MKVAKTPSQVASDVQQFLQDAVGDMASDMTSESSGFLDDAWAQKIKRAKRRGVSDIQGWLADELYNDVDTLMDLAGDKIHDGVGGNEVQFRQVCQELERTGHSALKEAARKLREPHG